MTSDTKAKEHERIQRAMDAIDRLQQRLAEVERAPGESIAVMGMGCRFPGQVNSPESFWQLLEAARHGICKTPDDRWNSDHYLDSNPNTVGKIITNQGGFLDRIQEFDPGFFGITPKETASMDPQHRLLLEVTWEAMEDAGMVPSSWAGKSVGVFIGISSHDYSRHLMKRPEEAIDAYLATGNAHSVAAGRLSYTYGFTGPSFVVDTACSSSLVAIHQACQSLRLRESNAAIVGAVNCLFSPELSIAFSQARMLSPAGRCKTFDAHADGFVRAEGCGAVVLKRLSDARAAGDPILALIAGSAINQDGSSGGLTVPNGPSQQSVIRQALKQAGIGPEEIYYLEAHGTGTELGDPIELNALGAVFGDSHSKSRPLHVGSVKTNLGHMEAAAGMGGLLKVILAMRHGLVPPHLHFQQPTPHVDWEQLPLQVTEQPLSWDSRQSEYAGVSSFGFSGTNAHVILRRVDDQPPVLRTDADSNEAVLLLSARSEKALNDLRLAYAKRLESGADWYDLCWTAYRHRSRFEQRAAIAASGSQEAMRALKSDDSNKPGSIKDAKWLSLAEQFLNKEEEQWPGEPGQRLNAPTYPFQRRIHWIDEPGDKSIYSGDSNHPFLGVKVKAAQRNEVYFDLGSSVFTDSVWQDHQVFDHPVFPAVGFVEIIVAAIREVCGSKPFWLKDLSFIHVLPLAHESHLQLILQPHRDGGTLEIVNQSGDRECQKVCKADWIESETSVSTVEASSDQHLKATDVYRRLEQQGVTYGSSWHLLDSIRVADGSVCAELNTQQLSSEYFYHPVALDACIQSIAALFIDDKQSGTFLPEGIGKVVFHQDRIIPGLLQSRVKVEKGDAWLRANVCLMDLKGNRVVSMEDFRLRPISSSWKSALASFQQPFDSPGISEEALEKWFYVPTWQLEALVFPPVFSIAEIAKTLKQDLVRQMDEADNRTYLDRLPELNLYTMQSVEESLETLGANPVVASQERYFRWLKETANRLEHEGSELAAERSDLEINFQRELLLIDRILHQLPAVLRGKLEATEVLFPNGDTSELTWLYELSPGSRLLNRQILASVESIHAQLGRPLRILEIGAGTGGTTASLMEWLPKDGHYTVTDISTVLVESARHRFGDRSNVRFETLDIERSPLEQGYRRGQFDMIIAANVLHATRDLNQTLDHVQELLIPSGHLILLEGTQPLLWLDLIFGPTKGWWAFDDTWRKNHPLLDKSKWLEVLDVKGFEAESISDDRLPQSVFIARSREKIDDSTKSLVCSVVDLEGDIVSKLHQGVERVLDVVQKTKNHAPHWPSLTIVTQGGVGAGCQHPEQGAIWGLARTVELECPELRCLRIDLDPLESVESQNQLIQSEIRSGTTGAVQYRAGKRYVARLQRTPSIARLGKRPEQPFEIQKHTSVGGCVDYSQMERRSPEVGEVEIRVDAAGINFVDALDMAGVLPFEREGLGVECVGEVVRVGASVSGFKVGDRVLALASGTFRTHVTIPAVLVRSWPDGGVTPWEAATWPANFLTAYRSLRDTGRLSKGETILIHAAAGGTGMASVLVAKALGATVFATASRDKWQVLRAMRVEHIMDSRTIEFANEIMRLTNNRGVDMVLNSLSGDYIQKGFDILAPGGRFIELGKRDIWSQEKARETRADVAYHLIDLFSESQQLAQSASTLGSKETLFQDFNPEQPLPLTQFPVEETPRALRYFQRSKHIGKVVLNFLDPHIPICKESAYLITGGLGGLGMATAAWMMEQGAQRVWLLGRETPKMDSDMESLPETLREWIQQGKAHLGSDMNEQGASIELVSCDVADRVQLSKVIEQISEQAPLRGVFHAAGVLEDATLDALTWSQVERVIRPKIFGAQNLHELTQQCRLDFFVMYSSAASLLGSPGQASHVTANSFLDSLAHHRRACGLPAQSINWGPWADIGSASSTETSQLMTDRGIAMMDPKDGIKALERVMQRPDLTQVGVLDANWERLGSLGLIRDDYFQHVISAPKTSSKRGQKELKDQEHWLRELRKIPSGQRLVKLVQWIQMEIAQVIGLPEGELPSTQMGFFDMGVDSLMSVDLKNRLSKQLGLDISPTLLFQHPNIDSLAAKLIHQLFGSDAQPQIESIEQSGSADKQESSNNSQPKPACELKTNNLESAIESELSALKKLLDDE